MKRVELARDKLARLRKLHVAGRLREIAQQKKTANTLKAAIQKKHGKESLRLLTEAVEVTVPCLSTGRQEFDDLLTGVDDVKHGGTVPGSGHGLPKGRIVELFGPESSGKTTLSLSWMAAIQQQGGIVAMVDAEHAFDPKWAQKLGVDTQQLLLSQPDYGEEALEIVEDLARSGKVAMIVVDSVAALVPKKELEGDFQKSHMGQQAAMMSKHLRRLKGIANKSGTIIVFINQIRMKIGVMFGNPETTPGGLALKFYSSIRLDIRFGGQLKKSVKVNGKPVDKAYASRARLKVQKNKVAAPFRTTKFIIEYMKGITEIGEDV